MTADHETSSSPAVIDAADLAVIRASGLVAARTLQTRVCDPERITSNGRDHPCPRCGSRNVARIAYGRIIVGPNDPMLAGGEVVLGGCLVARERFNCNACGHRFVEGAGALEPGRTEKPEDQVLTYRRQRAVGGRQLTTRHEGADVDRT